jgi:hypothetical protein
MGVLVIALFLVPSPDRGSDRLDDHYFAAVAVAHLGPPGDGVEPSADGRDGDPMVC